MLDTELYVKVENGMVVSKPTVLNSPNSVGLTMEARIESGWYPVEPVRPDTMDHSLEVWESETYDILEDRVVWTLSKRNKTQEELDKEKADWWKGHRIERNFKLAETDWVIIKSLELGTPVPAEWITYRQALRDITTNPDFNGSNYPVKPST